jgi:transcriptional regulator with XRE-family HTH domain
MNKIELTKERRERFKEARRHANLTQAQLAEAAKTTGIGGQHDVSKIESIKKLEKPERAAVPLGYVQKLSELTGFSIQYLLDQSNDKSEASATTASEPGFNDSSNAHRQPVDTNRTVGPTKEEIDVNSEVSVPAKYVQSLFKSSEYREAIFDFVLQRDYDDVTHKTELKNAKSLDCTGTNLRRIASKTYGHILAIKNILNNDGIVRLLMHRPDNVGACRYAMIQEFGPDYDLENYIRELVRKNLRTFCKIRADATKAKKGKLLIRTLDYALTFGLDVINGNSDVIEDSDASSGIIYVRFYPLPKRSEKLEDKPIIRLEYGDGPWYVFFREQFDHHWMNRNEGGFAEDLPENYDETP